MNKERDYFKSILYVAVVWVLAIIFRQVVYANSAEIIAYFPFLEYYVNGGFLTLFLAIIGTIIVWIKTGEGASTKVDKKKSLEKTPPEPLTISKSLYLDSRLAELSKRFPVVESAFSTTIKDGVTSYKRRKHLPQVQKYYFDDYFDLSDLEYNQLCFMRNTFGIPQCIFEDLEFIRGNDIPLYYETDYILSYFKEKYRPDQITLDMIRQNILRHNWEMARRELRRVHKSWR